MTDTAKARYLAFLSRKSKALFSGLQGANEESSLPNRVIQILVDVPAEQLKLSSVRQIDAEIEMMAREAVGRDKIESVVNALKKEFGFGRIADDPGKIIRRVIKRERIATDDELRTVLDVLAFVDYPLDAQDRAIIEKFARIYEGR